MLFIGDRGNKGLSNAIGKLLNIPVIYPDHHVFPDGEQRVRILEPVAGQKVAVLKSTSTPVDNNLMEFLFIVDALKQNGAREIFGIIPYLGYSRADHMFRTGEAVPLELVIQLIQTAGLDKILFIDPHSIKIPEMFRIPVVDESALPIFAKKIEELGCGREKCVVVSPDMGGIRRIKKLAELLGGIDYVSVEKDRDLETGNVEVSQIHGGIKETCFIVDDMISSGGTIVKAVDALLAQGARDIYVFATHPVFSDEAPKLLQYCAAEKVYVCDTIDVPREKRFHKLEILSSAGTITKHLQS